VADVTPPDSVLLAHCRKFAEAVFDIYREGDVVWAQDYHLMLLPAMLKKQHPKMKVHCTVEHWQLPSPHLRLLSP
jgi:trehalose-6-phosphate synthase